MLKVSLIGWSEGGPDAQSYASQKGSQSLNAAQSYPLPSDLLLKVTKSDVLTLSLLFD